MAHLLYCSVPPISLTSLPSWPLPSLFLHLFCFHAISLTLLLFHILPPCSHLISFTWAHQLPTCTSFPHPPLSILYTSPDPLFLGQITFCALLSFPEVLIPVLMILGLWTPLPALCQICSPDFLILTLSYFQLSKAELSCYMIASVLCFWVISCHLFRVITILRTRFYSGGSCSQQTSYDKSTCYLPCAKLKS